MQEKNEKALSKNVNNNNLSEKRKFPLKNPHNKFIINSSMYILLRIKSKLCIEGNYSEPRRIR